MRAYSKPARQFKKAFIIKDFERLVIPLYESPLDELAQRLVSMDEGETERVGEMLLRDENQQPARRLPRPAAR